jgi:hypothetical protein
MAERTPAKVPRKRAAPTAKKVVPRKAVPRVRSAKQEPLVLSGSPHAVRGIITLANTGTERLVIRGALLHLPGREPIAVPLTALVAPGSTTETAVSVDLGAGWSAGTTLGELEVNGQRRDVELRVVQSVGVAVSPSEALVEVGSTRVSLLVHNFGNVSVRLARVTRGRLIPHDWGDPHIHSSGDPHVHDSGDPHEDATLRLRSSLLLQPGDETSIQAEVEIPKDLPVDRRHRAVLPVGPADLIVTVLPSDPRATTTPKPRTPTRKES